MERLSDRSVSQVWAFLAFSWSLTNSSQCTWSSSRPMNKSVPMGQHGSYATVFNWVQVWFPCLLPILGKFPPNQNFSLFVSEHMCLWSSPPNTKNVDTEHPHSWRSQDGFIWVTRSRDDSTLPGYVRSSSHIQLKSGLLSTTDHLTFIYQWR